MHADRTNRVASRYLLVCCCSPSELLAWSRAWVVSARSSSRRPCSPIECPVISGSTAAWLWPVIAVGCALVAVLMLRWIYVLIASTDRADDVVIRGDHDAGRTVLATGGVGRGSTRRDHDLPRCVLRQGPSPRRSRRHAPHRDRCRLLDGRHSRAAAAHRNASVSPCSPGLGQVGPAHSHVSGRQPGSSVAGHVVAASPAPGSSGSERVSPAIRIPTGR